MKAAFAGARRGLFVLSAAPQKAATRWRDGLELLMVGGATLALVPISIVLRSWLDLADAELAVGFVTFYAAYVINDPHFTVTYVLFYRGVGSRLRDLSGLTRARYALAGFIVPSALLVWGGASIATHSAQSIGWMVQLMFLLVGWHYAKQGFGVFSVISARRGVRVRPRERVALLFHAYSGWAFAWANPATTSGEFEEKGVVYTQLAHPRWFELATASIFAASTVALGLTLALKWRSDRRMFPLAPLSGFLITIWSWTIFTSVDPLIRYVIPALHSVQYLYFVWLMRRNEARAAEGPPHFGRPVSLRLGALALTALVLGWILFHGLPEFLDTAFVPRAQKASDDPMGPTPYFAVLYVIVNVHHYFMDNVIWRRDNPDTRWLFADDSRAAG